MKSLTTWWTLRQTQATDPIERARAIRKLAHCTDDDSRTAMLDALSDGEVFVRAAAAAALGESGRREAVAPLVAALLEEKEHLAIEALIEALRSIDVDMAVRQLLPALNEADIIARSNAATALHLIGWEELSVSEKVRVAVVRSDWEEVIALGVAAVAPLVRAFHGGSPAVMREAAEALGMMEAPEASGALVKLLVDPKLPRAGREIASWALRKFRSHALPLDVGAWVAVTDGDWEQAESFGKTAVEPLKYALFDDRREAARMAALTLKKIGGKEAVEALSTVLKDIQQDVAVREIAANLLGDLNEAEALPALVGALNDESWTVREEAAHALRRLHWTPEDDTQQILCAIALQEWPMIQSKGEGAIPALLDALRYQSVGSLVAKALLQIGDVGINALLSALKSAAQPMSVREVIAQTLAEAGDARAIEPVQTMLNDPDMVVRQMAVWTLERFGWTPGNDQERALVAIAHEQWDALPPLGAAAADVLLALARQELAPRETVDALGEVTAACAQHMSIEQLHQLAALPDLRQRNSNVFITREACKLPMKPSGGTDMVGRTAVVTPAHASEGGTEISREAFVSCSAIRQLARVELTRRGMTA